MKKRKVKSYKDYKTKTKKTKKKKEFEEEKQERKFKKGKNKRFYLISLFNSTSSFMDFFYAKEDKLLLLSKRRNKNLENIDFSPFY